MNVAAEPNNVPEDDQSRDEEEKSWKKLTKYFKFKMTAGVSAAPPEFIITPVNQNLHLPRQSGAAAPHPQLFLNQLPVNQSELPAEHFGGMLTSQPEPVRTLSTNQTVRIVEALASADRWISPWQQQ